MPCFAGRQLTAVAQESRLPNIAVDMMIAKKGQLVGSVACALPRSEALGLKAYQCEVL